MGPARLRAPRGVLARERANSKSRGILRLGPLTSNIRWADAPGNILLRARGTGLPEESVANVSHISTVDRAMPTERTGRVSSDQLRAIYAGLDIVLGKF